jgi:hypothetical protein
MVDGLLKQVDRRRRDGNFLCDRDRCPCREETGVRGRDKALNHREIGLRHSYHSVRDGKNCIDDGDDCLARDEYRVRGLDNARGFGARCVEREDDALRDDENARPQKAAALGHYDKVRHHKGGARCPVAPAQNQKDNAQNDEAHAQNGSSLQPLDMHGPALCYRQCAK